MNSHLKLRETKHFNKKAQEGFDNLVGIDSIKNGLLEGLSILLNESGIKDWMKKHHSKEKPFALNRIKTGVPLIILSGEVGCGKTALAHTVASPLAKKIDKSVITFETPSNIRGGGMVGEISNRITEAFEIVGEKLNHDELGLLIIDEADDIGTSRSQNQAHHEDRAGLNALIKELDLVKLEEKRFAVIIITNRVQVLDPALIRRATFHFEFNRPDENSIIDVFQHLLQGTDFKESEVRELRAICKEKPHPFSFSDILQRAAEASIFRAIQEDKPFSIKILKEVLTELSPTPLIEKTSITQMNKK